MPVVDMVGHVFGRLTVVARVGTTPSGSATWLCACSCGNETTVSRDHLRSGCTHSCGCFYRDTRGEQNRKHGLAESPTYTSWYCMIHRCTNAHDIAFDRYGGRGIKVCARWLGTSGLENFFADMGPRPSLSHSIDRYPNNDGNYERGNCRWATRKQQARNRRSNRLITAFGQTRSLVEWAHEVEVARTTIAQRIDDLGWTPEDALTSARGSVQP